MNLPGKGWTRNWRGEDPPMVAEDDLEVILNDSWKYSYFLSESLL